MTHKNVMYFSGQEYMLYTAKKMQDNGWKPVFWSTNPTFEKKVTSTFPKAITYDHVKLSKGMFSLELKEKIEKINIDLILKKLSIYEGVIMSMIDRHDSLSNSITKKEKNDHYHSTVKYWVYIIDKTKPDYAIFEEEPHMACEYILYAILKTLKIKTIMFINTKFHKTMYPLMNFEDGSKIIKNRYNKNIDNLDTKIFGLSNENLSYLKKVRGSVSEAMEFHLYNQKKEIEYLANNKKVNLNKIKFFIKFIYVRLFNKEPLKRFFFLFNIKSARFGKFDSNQKQYGKLLNKSNLTYLEYIYYGVKTIIKKEYLKIYYNKISSKNFSINTPYLYCQLHYQPERTTCPMGNSFDDQIKMIRLLSEACPDNWKIYVKEHPSQFVTNFIKYGERYRSINYYKEILALPNVVIVSLDYDNFKLIDNAKATVSVASTGGWESLVRSKPSINFGYSWYSFCRGNFYVHDLNSLKHAINKIQEGYKVNKLHVETFVHTIQNNSFRAYLGGMSRQNDNVSEEEIGLSHAEAINQILSSDEYSNDV